MCACSDVRLERVRMRPFVIARRSSTDQFALEETLEPMGWWLGFLLWTLGRAYRRPVLRPYFGR